jgi:hypothetical protein
VEIAVLLVVLAIGVLTVAALAERLDVPPPLLLIAVGAAVSYIPGVPEVHLEPEVVLLGLLPPLLYATAIQSSLVDFNTNRRSQRRWVSAQSCIRSCQESRGRPLLRSEPSSHLPMPWLRRPSDGGSVFLGES